MCESGLPEQFPSLELREWQSEWLLMKSESEKERERVIQPLCEATASIANQRFIKAGGPTPLGADTAWKGAAASSWHLRPL